MCDMYMYKVVKRNSADYNIPLRILSFKDLFGWSLDDIVQQEGNRTTCTQHVMMCVMSGTYCGVFRRQALDKGAMLMQADKIATGHNADDIAETVFMNGNFIVSRCHDNSAAWRHSSTEALHCY